MMDDADILAIAEEAFLNHAYVQGAAQVGNGVNIQFVGDRRWWRIEVREITQQLDAAFGSKA